MYRAGDEMAIYSKKKEFEYIATSVSTSRDIGGRSTVGWGFERLGGLHCQTLVRQIVALIRKMEAV
jgi:hypothetical protein